MKAHQTQCTPHTGHVRAPFCGELACEDTSNAMHCTLDTSLRPSVASLRVKAHQTQCTPHTGHVRAPFCGELACEDTSNAMHSTHWTRARASCQRTQGGTVQSRPPVARPADLSLATHISRERHLQQRHWFSFLLHRSGECVPVLCDAVLGTIVPQLRCALFASWVSENVETTTP